MSRRAAPPTVALGQIAYASPNTDEVAVHGLLGVYRPDAGPVEAGAARGGFFDLDMSGIQGQTRRLLQTDLNAWHWEGLELPAGVRFAPFQYTVRTTEPITAVARFGPEGLDGKLTPGPFRGLADAVLSPPGGRNLAVRLGPDATFRAGGQDALPDGQFLADAVLTRQQQRRQALYHEFLKRPAERGHPGRGVLLAWAEPVETHFTLDPKARRAGDALLVVPLRLERPAAGTRVTVPGPFVACRRIMDGLPVPPTLRAAEAADMHLRFQLPDEVLPLQVERARLAVKINALSRRVTVGARADGRFVEVHQADSPISPVRVDVSDGRLLRLDEGGGLHLNLAVGAARSGARDGSVTGRRPENWTIEYIELEVTGRTADVRKTR
jgi:hypothetical protein